MAYSGWRGCSNVGMRSHGDMGDPDLVIKFNGDTFVFNYWDIESALWEDFLNSLGITEEDTYDEALVDKERYVISDEYESQFDEYCQANAYDYMVDCIADGYFGWINDLDPDIKWDPYDEEYTWHYDYRSKEAKDIYYELVDLLDYDACDAMVYLRDEKNKEFSRIGKIYYIDAEPIGDINDLEIYLYENEPDWDEVE